MSSTGQEGPDPVADDSATGEPGIEQPDQPAETAEVGATDPAEASEPSVEQQLSERIGDLQRLQAEYLNYKKRVDRDRETAKKSGEAAVLQALLTTLDDIGRARQHGELEGGFKSVADSINAVATKFGLEAFGEKGDSFDPQLHEAVIHAGESADVEVTSIDNVMLTGYRVSDRILRPATVAVVDPAAGTAEAPDQQPQADEPTISDVSAANDPE